MWMSSPLPTGADVCGTDKEHAVRPDSPGNGEKDASVSFCRSPYPVYRGMEMIGRRLPATRHRPPGCFDRNQISATLDKGVSRIDMQGTAKPENRPVGIGGHVSGHGLIFLSLPS